MIRSTEKLKSRWRHLTLALTTAVALSACGADVSSTSPASSDVSFQVESMAGGGQRFRITGPEGGPFPDGARDFRLVNPNPHSVDWTVRTEVDWLNTGTTDTGTIPPGGSTIVTISIDQAVATALTVGEYPTVVQLRDGAGSTQAVLSFVLAVQPVLEEGRIQVPDTGTFELTGDVGGPVTPTQRVYRVFNVGGAPVDYLASVSHPWLFIQGADSGSVDPGGQASVTVRVDQAVVAGFGVGDYQASVSFVNTTNGVGNTERAATLELTDPTGSTGRVVDDLQVLYDFEEGGGSVVADISGVGTPLDLSIPEASAVTWAPGALSIHTPTILTSGSPATKVVQACSASSEISLEAWIRPANTTQDGPTRIVSISGGVSSRNATLGQGLWGSQPSDTFNARLRTTATDLDGMPLLTTSAGAATTSLTHVMYTRSSAGAARLYVNGQLSAESQVDGDLSNWDGGFALALANEFGVARPWLGDLHLVAIYARALSATEVGQNFGAGPGDLGAGHLLVQPHDDFVIDGPPGGDFFPLSKVYYLANSGTEPLSWSLSGLPAWLSGTQLNGMLGAGQSTEVTLQVDVLFAQGLAEGDHQASLSFTNESTGFGSTTREAILRIRDPASLQAGGLFLSPQDLDRARARATGNVEPFASSYQMQHNRAVGNLSKTADPFHMDDMSIITYGWCGQDTDDIDNTLREAVDKFDIQSDWMRCLALEYALTGDTQFADKALQMMLVWAEEHTPVNLYFFNPDFLNGTMDGGTTGYCSDRPFNFGYDLMFQGYGLTNSCDAYLLLTRNGYSLSAEDDAAIRAWLLECTEAVNSGFHAWTKWGDLHDTGCYTCIRARSDNHLSWCLSGLISGAIALQDDELKEYVINGGTWVDSQAGPYANPSYFHEVINMAIESGTGSSNEGRVYEELIMRSPPIGYSFFHLQAMQLVAIQAEVHYGLDLWTSTGPDGGNMELAYDRYADFVLGDRVSPEPSAEGDLTVHSWQYERLHARWPKPRYAQVIQTTDRQAYRRQAIGPVVLLLGEDLP